MRPKNLADASDGVPKEDRKDRKLIRKGRKDRKDRKDRKNKIPELAGRETWTHVETARQPD